MPTKAIAAAVTAVGAIVCLASPAASFEVEGHRGARWARPANTLAAFRYALSLGVDTLEMDLHVTKDDVLVVTHDPFSRSALTSPPAHAISPPVSRDRSARSALSACGERQYESERSISKKYVNSPARTAR